jgi:quinolinate synthase
MGIIYRLKQDNPDKIFHVPTDQFICANMKLTTLGWLARSLEKEIYEITVPEEVAVKARKALEKMLAVTSYPGNNPG